MTKEIANKLAELLSKNDERLYDEIFKALDKERTKVHSIIKTPSIIKLSKLVAREKPQIDLDFLLNLWKRSMENEKELVFGVKAGRAVRLFFIGLISFIKDDRLKKEFVDKVTDFISDWETCDQLAMKITKPLCIADESYFDVLCAYLESENPWKRRLPIATIAYLAPKMPKKKGYFLEILERVRNDKSLPVKKAIRWAVNELKKVS